MLFRSFGGVPKRIAYDNTKTAVAKILGSRDREVTREFGRLRSYHQFAPHFCLVRRPNEKGHVERLLDYARSNFLVPVPAIFFLGLWFALQVWQGGASVTHPEASGGVALFAHIGGFVFGMLVVRALAVRPPLRPSW